MIGISEETEIGDDISIGDMVEVEGLISEGGTLLAIEIELDEQEVEENSDVTEVDDLDDDDIEFTGLVQAIAGDAWVIGSKTVYMTPESEIDDDITIGDVVEVEAQINEDGSLTALEIELEDDDLEDNDLDSDPDDADDDDSSEADYLDGDNDSDEDDG
jgi:ribonuclease E